MRRLLLIPALAICTETVGAATLAVAAQAGRFNAQLDTLTHFTPLYCAGAFLGLLAAIMLPALLRRITVMAAVVGLLASGTLMAPELVTAFQFRPSVPANGDFKVVQFNAWGGNPKPQQELAWLLKQNADVIVLEEGGPVQYDLVKFGGYHLSCGNCHAEILTKAAPSWTNTPANWRIVPDEVSVVNLSDPAGEITVLGVHRSWPNRPWFYEAQMADLARSVAKFPTRRMIVAGDFNSTPWSFARRREDKELGLTRRTQAVFTWPADNVSHDRIPAPLAVLPIDHVYAGPGWETVSVERGPRLGSDHYPVVVILRRVKVAHDAGTLAMTFPGIGQ